MQKRKVKQSYKGGKVFDVFKHKKKVYSIYFALLKNDNAECPKNDEHSCLKCNLKFETPKAGFLM